MKSIAAFLATAAMLVGGLSLGCTHEDNDHMDHMDDGHTDAPSPMVSPGRDASGARSPDSKLQPMNPNGDGVGATGTGAGGGNNHMETNMGPNSR